MATRAVGLSAQSPETQRENEASIIPVPGGSFLVTFLRRIISSMKTPFSKLPEALVRLLIVFAAVIGLTIVIVKFVIPPRFKDTKIQWADTVARETAKP